MSAARAWARRSVGLAAVLGALGGVGAAAESTPLALAEGQVAALTFERKVLQVAVSDTGVLAARASGTRVEVVGRQGGNARLKVDLEGGLGVLYEVRVAGAERAAAAAEPRLVELRPGEERRIAIPGVDRVMVEDNGVARARAERGALVVSGVAPGTASLLVVQDSGAKVEWTIRVRP